MKTFSEKYKEARKDKKSLLCVGLDVASKNADKSDTLLDCCLELVETTCEYAVAYKPNTQFLLFPLTVPELRKLNEKIRSCGCVSILDHKLCDIGSSNEAALGWIERTGFDAFTYSPFPGNIKESIGLAHKYGLGIFVLALMSNPEAEWIQKETRFSGLPLYEAIAREVRESKGDGLVVGTTNHVTSEDLKRIRDAAGEETIFLCPGIGAQGGDVEKILASAGENVLINVGRAVITAEDPSKAARGYRDLINRYLKTGF